MPNIPEDLRCTKDHEWVREVGGKADGRHHRLRATATRGRGVVQLPSAGDRFEETDPLGSVDSVNTDPYGDGRLVVNGSASSHDLLTAAQYADYVKEESG
ncbi:hypothetical protein ACOBQX_09335 [Actinokineospora sp. G85]|uniref:hypothetical protein n=1 Tax=Actinokineospora sp. G85 TaxID=3406626 RepID=UPI003C72651E